ncbi:hypothetical protein B0F90DRAFT_1820622 [Multifurca ochricompacta]|uniref:NB-ARC domain-containing protein n=1 Tax=Multifurca ochricompacta TaxID=376703 RepID=A0AAD4LV59_9AGAM|nr:hypothetical protein B0F90DRAFT_1827819 [Multifurca ochricompacta]KAI0295348.1 hypothetical protein B0F90DRAFT_1820622 [Multifurca ochricompacta]
MDSKLSSFRKRVYELFPASSSGQQPASDTLNLGSSGPIGGYSAIADNAIQLSLASLKEGSALAGKIPYIAPIAGLLLQALTIRDEVKQYKGECEDVIQKLIRVAGLVINVGQSCQTHNLNEGDLPAGLRAILKSLQSELDGIKHVLEECSKVRGVRSLLLRKDLLGKIKKYDARLANALEVFQAELLLDIRFTQIADRRDGPRAIPTEITMWAFSIRVYPVNVNVFLMLPRSVVQPAIAPPLPQIFFGRDTELAHIIHIIFTKIASRPARIAILGPGGYGKTTLANAVLGHDRIQEHFRDARYFISCESASSSDALLIQLAKTLGLVMGSPDTLWPQVQATLNSKETILCFDNFESPWDQSDETKRSVEVLLSRITALRRVTVLLTMRGAERPGQTEWTRPFLEPLGTIDLNAAKEIWIRISGHYDSFSEQLIVAVDCVPLAVDLLAHLSQVTPPMLLWEEWNSRRTKLIKKGEMNRLSNMEYSIQISLDSHRMVANPLAKGLLGILSTLPDGLHIKQLNKFKGILTDMDMMSCLQALQQCSLINLIGDRYQPHPIIRQFCNNRGFTSSTHKTALEEFYISLASLDVERAAPEAYAEMVLEANNTKAMLSGLLKSNSGNQSRLINAIISFTEFCMNIGDFSSTLLDHTVQLPLENSDDATHLIKCLRVWGRLCYSADDMETAKKKFLEAERQCLSSPVDVGDLHGYILTDLGLVYLSQFLLNEAETTYKKALEIFQANQNISGQGSVHYGLGKIYLLLGKLIDAEASYQKALGFHINAGDIIGQGNDHQGLGDTYLRMDKLAEAEVSYKKALEFQKMANHIMNQGNAHRGLGHIYRRLNKLDEADISYHKALELDMASNNLFNLGIVHQGLGETYLLMNKLNGAEASFQKSLEVKKAANDVLGQGIAMNGLGRVYMERSQLEEAKSMFEEALKLHKQIKATTYEQDDQLCLDDVLDQMRSALK